MGSALLAPVCTNVLRGTRGYESEPLPGFSEERDTPDLAETRVLLGIG